MITILKNKRDSFKEKILQSWTVFKSLDKFFKFQIISLLLIVAASSTITASHFIFRSNAATDYVVDASILNELNLINSYRVSKGLTPLTPVATLTNAARWKAQDMAAKSYMNHYDSTCKSASCSKTFNNNCQGDKTCGRWFSDLQRKYGYTFNTYRAENLEWDSYPSGQDDSPYVLSGWQNSTGHNAVLLGNYSAVGIYRATGANSTNYWAAEFGSYTDSPVTYVTSSTVITPTFTPTPTPASNITPTPTPTSSGSCTSGTDNYCGTNNTSPSGVYPYYTNYAKKNSCTSGALQGGTSCSTGTYCALTAANKTTCVSGCTQRGFTCASSCLASNIIPSNTNGYSCPSGGICCSTTSTTPTPTPASILTPTPTPAPGGCTNGYLDSDSDGYGTGAYGCYTGTVASVAGDTCDSDSRVHPGQTAGFTAPNNCGNYDYNSNGVSTIVGTYYSLSGLASSVRLNCVGGTCSSCTNGNYTPPFNNSYTTTCGQTGGINCTYAYFNPGVTSCPASGTAAYRAGCTSTLTACN